ncbi:hypothetical protein [Achromobacter aegrifaciens]
MPGGLQISDAAARLIFDTNYRVSRFLEIVQPGLGVSVYRDDRLLNGTPFAFYVFEGISTAFTVWTATPQMTAPQFAFSGNTLTVTRAAPPPTSQADACTVYYGVR